ncbi:hypothetical protein [Nocardia sp. NPDC050717]|uniref:hypothetical protein n=1 Tax=Nocardia sp. NPDC050717 TaxID=3157221 RepID=UPI0033EBD2DF
MHAPTPQDTLALATAATERARNAPPTPRWFPPTMGMLGGGATMLITAALPTDGAARTVLGIAGIVLTLLLFGLMAWLTGVRRKVGVMPRAVADEPTRRWLRIGLFAVPPLVAGALAALVSGWQTVAAGAVIGAWIWYSLTRRRA